MDKSLFNSKKFKAALVGAASAGLTQFVIVFCKGMGIDIPQELVLMVLAPFLAYIGAKGAADIAYNARNGGAVEIPFPEKTTTAATDSGIPKIICPRCGKLVDNRTWCSECDYVLQPTVPPTPQYYTPVLVEEFGADQATAFLRWVSSDSMLDWDLTQYSPQIRMDYAMDILEEDKKRLVGAWLEGIKLSNASRAFYPESQDFDSYEATEAFKKEIRDITPGCNWLTVNQNTMLRGYRKYFKGLEWVSKLSDKNINWQLAHSINELAEHKYAAVI